MKLTSVIIVDCKVIILIQFLAGIGQVAQRIHDVENAEGIGLVCQNKFLEDVTY